MPRMVVEQANAGRCQPGFVPGRSPRLANPLWFCTRACAPQVREIAQIKLPDLNCTDLDAACNTVMGTARNMGITVEA